MQDIKARSDRHLLKRKENNTHSSLIYLLPPRSEDSSSSKSRSIRYNNLKKLTMDEGTGAKMTKTISPLSWGDIP